mmetsp:Transcript_26830/g.44863  ORF Transcript_26830/g.44863 Transcript_26830/m.44863 type:complete len:588 (-) Transcript_26830:133-1896(-)
MIHNCLLSILVWALLHVQLSYSFQLAPAGAKHVAPARTRVSNLLRSRPSQIVPISQLVSPRAKFHRQLTLRMATDRREKFEELSYTPPKYILDIAKKYSNQRLTVADVASSAGIDIATANRDLLQLSYAVGATLEVSESGEILFQLPDDYDQKLLQKSIARRLQVLYERAYPPLFYLFRTSFGVMLILSLAIISTAIIAVSSSSSDDSDSNSRSSYSYGRRQSLSFNMMLDLTDIADLLSYKSRRDQMLKTGIVDEKRPMNFLESCYSYVFGDGNPNADYERELAKRAAQMIRSNKGIVIAEQLAPFLLNPPNPDAYIDPYDSLPPLSDLTGALTTSPSATAAAAAAVVALDGASVTATRAATSSLDTSMSSNAVVVDESYILPYTLRYQGEPLVSDEGQIVYKFNDLLVTAQDDFASKKDDSKDDSVSEEMLLLEEPIPFSEASSTQRSMALSLGILNLGGASILGDLLSKMALRGAVGNSLYLAWVSRAYPFLLGYAVLYNAVPLARYFWTKRQNEQIDSRNSFRRKWLQRLQSDKALKSKIQDKNNYVATQQQPLSSGEVLKTLGDADVVFTSKSPVTSTEDEK